MAIPTRVEGMLPANTRPVAPTATQKAGPNPSLEPTPTGLALGPRNRFVYHRSRGPSANPAGSAQLTR